MRVRFRGEFAYIDGDLGDADATPLCRLRYNGSANLWEFAIYRASHHDYQDSILPSGAVAGSPEEALDCACGLYLGDPNRLDWPHHRYTDELIAVATSVAVLRVGIPPSLTSISCHRW